MPLKKALLHIINQQGFYQEFQRNLTHKNWPMAIHGLAAESVGHFCAALTELEEKKAVIIMENEMKARQLFDQLQGLGVEKPLYFPGKDYVLHEIDVMDQHERGFRLEALHEWILSDTGIMVTSWKSFLVPLTPKEALKSLEVKLEVGQILEIEELLALLMHLGYSQEDMVEGFGQFSHRGGIVDVFPVGEKHPIRLEFFGDEIDTIRYFDRDSQRSIESVEETFLTPSREWLIDETQLPTIEANLREVLKDHPSERMEEVAEWISQGIIPENRELLIPFVEDSQWHTLWDYIDDGDWVFFAEQDDMPEVLETNTNILSEQIVAMVEDGDLVEPHFQLTKNLELWVDRLKANQVILISALLPNRPLLEVQAMIKVLTRPAIHYGGRWHLFLDELQRNLYRGYRVIIVTDQKERIDSLIEKLREEHIPAVNGERHDGQVEVGQVMVLHGYLGEGFSYVDGKVTILSEHQVMGTKQKTRKRTKKTKGLGSLGELTVGDYVVHETYGIGIYQGTREMTIDHVLKDYIHIKYGGSDQLYLPVDQLGTLHKYVGKPGGKVKVNKLQSMEWKKTKAKAQRAVEEMAQELIQLYHERSQAEGFVFSKDTPWQLEFEDQFPFEETPGQEEAIEEVKEDMETSKPMDRLICADVGYGKTEVALRAAFKAIMDDKQVAFLVPTTILAQQHYATAQERFQGFPMRVEVLNRFKTKKQQREILTDLKKGFVDLVIGTHRLLSEDVKFKDLGLLIVDEEQRFGVKDKERLKMMTTSVDTISLSATPIPRTLQMAMTGIRDMSTIEDPPDERFPINTMVTPFQPLMVREAILREMERGGQSYVVYNRVANMHLVADSLRELIPEARIAMAHGQMSEKNLEKVMMDFYRGEYDVLLSSTIIEIGMDIQNANTMIVMDAHRLGLSQLYQLRGRIGRWNRLAYCYFTYPQREVLKEGAQKRLMAMKQFTAFGSGFQIAMKDLEIRGAGNVLGLAQHGHMDAIGYDLYLKYLAQSVKRLKGEEIPDSVDTIIDIRVNAFIPKSYIPDEPTRLQMYQRIAELDDEQEERELIDELIDRFGDVPKPLQNLVEISVIRKKAMNWGIVSIIQNRDEVKILWADGYELALSVIEGMVEAYGQRLTLHMTENTGMTIKLKEDGLPELGQWINLMENLKNRENHV